MRSKLTKQDVQDALINTRVTISMLENNTNPQTQEIVFTAKGREAAFEAVLLAMRGDPVLLHIYSQNDKYDKPVDAHLESQYDEKNGDSLQE